MKGFLGRRRLAARLLLMSASVFAALLVVEVGLRIAGFTYFNPYTVDRELGFSLRPNAAGWWTREGKTYVTLNAHGFRDRGHLIAKPPGTFRIAILGDSFAEAFQVPLEKTFWSVLEQRISSCRPDMKIEVLNFGVSGFSTGRELIMLRNRVWQYSPDLIVLLFTPGNDVSDNSRKLDRNRVQALPYFVINEGKLELDDSLLAVRNRTVVFRLRESFLGRAFDWVQQHSRLLGLLYTIREQRDADEQLRRSVGNEPGLSDEVYRPPASAEWEEAWRVTERLLVAMHDEVRARGAKFLVVAGSSGIQVNPDAKKRQDFMAHLGITNLFYPNERIRSLGRVDGFPVIDLAPPLLEYATTNQMYVQGDAASGGRGHWNETGHRLAGQLIAEEICRERL
jgi:hypothetical protein